MATKRQRKDPRDRNITTHETAEGTMYTGHARVAGARAQSETHSTIEKARKFRDEKETEIRARLKHPVDSRSFLDETVHATIDQFLAIPPDQGGPDQKQSAHLRSAQKHVGGKITNAQINRAWCREHWQKMSATISDRLVPFKASTVAKHFGLMNAAHSRRAEQLGLNIPQGPFTTKVLPKGYDERRERRFEPGEEEALLEAIQAAPNSLAWMSFTRLALATGARLQEIALATWSEFHSANGKRYWRIPKGNSKTGARTVPLSPEALEALDAFASLKKRGERRLLWQYKNPNSVSCAMRGIRAAAGLVDLRFHDLRHEAISRIVVDRWWMSFALIGKMVGHSTADITDRYTHLRPEELISAFEGPASWQLRSVNAAPVFMAGTALTSGRLEIYGREQPAIQIGAKQAPPREALREPRELALAA